MNTKERPLIGDKEMMRERAVSRQMLVIAMRSRSGVTETKGRPGTLLVSSVCLPFIYNSTQDMLFNTPSPEARSYVGAVGLATDMRYLNFHKWLGAAIPPCLCYF